MKIDADLRCAIRSKEKAQPKINWDAVDKAHVGEIENLLKKRPRIAVALRRARRFKAQSEALEKKSSDIFKSYGLSPYDDGKRIGDTDKFLKAGGKLPSSVGARWTFGAVMAELAAAEPKERNKILLKYGIKWE